MYRVIFNQATYFRHGTIKEIPTVAKQHSLTKTFIVTDPVLLKTSAAEKVTKVLGEAGLPYEMFSSVKPNPPVECIRDGVAKFTESGTNFLIDLGGGPPRGTCKDIGIATTNPESADVLSLEGAAGTKNLSVPILDMPTAAGTASETTINCVATDTTSKYRFMVTDPHGIPIVAFMGPDLTDSMPYGLKVAAGFDVLTRAIEGYITPGTWSLSNCLSTQTIHMIARSPVKSANGGVPASGQMAYASYITGMVHSNVDLGLMHGIAYPPGSRLGMAHDVVSSILLAPVMEYNKDFTDEKYRDIVDAFGVEDTYTGDLEEVHEEATQAVHKLTVGLRDSTTISGVSVIEADLEPPAHNAFNGMCIPSGPRQTIEEDILTIYKPLM